MPAVWVKILLSGPRRVRIKEARHDAPAVNISLPHPSKLDLMSVKVFSSTRESREDSNSDGTDRSDKDGL